MTEHPEHLRLLRYRPLVFVDDLDAPRLPAGDQHHLGRVLRVAGGDPITLGDGAGRWREARYGAEPEPVGEVHAVAPPHPPVTVGFAPVKGGRPEWVVQKLTELGVDEIVPVVTARSVVRWDAERAARQHERLAKVASVACAQSRRLWLPVVGPPTPLAGFLAEHPDAVLADPSGEPMGPPEQVVVVGPEGGFSDDELAGAPAVSLPGNILRAETAALVAGTVACGFRASYFAH